MCSFLRSYAAALVPRLASFILSCCPPVASMLLLGTLTTSCDESDWQGGNAGRNTTLSLRAVELVGFGYADSSINTSIFREQSILRLSADKYVVAYFDRNGDARLDVLGKSGVVQRSVLVVPRLDPRLLNDGHCSINLGYSSDGNVHVLYGAHGTVPFYLSVDGHLLTESEVLYASSWYRRITYPQFYTVAGDLQLWFRADPESSINRVIYDAENETFPAKSEAIVNPGSTNSVYMNQLAVAGERTTLAWMFRMFAEDEFVRNEGLFLATSGDAGETWRGMDGSSVALPASPGSLEPFIALGPGREPLNQTATTYGPDGKLYLTYYATDSADIYQIFLATVDSNGTVEDIQVVSRNVEQFRLLGNGTLVLPMSRPQIVVSERNVHLVYRQDDDIVLATRERDNADAPWRYARIPVKGLGAWEPTISREAWEYERRLMMLVQSVRQGPGDTAQPGAPTQVQIYVFEERNTLALQ